MQNKEQNDKAIKRKAIQQRYRKKRTILRNKDKSLLTPSEAKIVQSYEKDLQRNKVRKRKKFDDLKVAYATNPTLQTSKMKQLIERHEMSKKKNRENRKRNNKNDQIQTHTVLI